MTFGIKSLSAGLFAQKFDTSGVKFQTRSVSGFFSGIPQSEKLAMPGWQNQDSSFFKDDDIRSGMRKILTSWRKFYRLFRIFIYKNYSQIYIYIYIYLLFTLWALFIQMFKRISYMNAYEFWSSICTFLSLIIFYFHPRILHLRVFFWHFVRYFPGDEFSCFRFPFSLIFASYSSFCNSKAEFLWKADHNNLQKLCRWRSDFCNLFSPRIWSMIILNLLVSIYILALIIG